MNQKGEVTLFAILILVILSGLMTLAGLQLEQSFRILQARTKIFLCVKETNQEMKSYLRFMGRTNWAIKNTNKVRLIMLIIPGLQGASLQADKIKKTLKHLQNLQLIKHLSTMTKLKGQGCPLDPALYMTPFQISASGYKRDFNEAAIIRTPTWTYHFIKLPYYLDVSYDIKGLESIHPKFTYQAEEKAGMLSSLFSSR